MASKATATSKAAKAPKKIIPTVIVPERNPDAEGDEDDEDMNASSSGGGGLTPSLQKEESSSPMTPKNFRNHPDMENFFRFIYENDLRLEALEIIDGIITDRKVRKKKAGNA